MIISYSVPKIWRVTDVIFIFHFGPIFAFLPLQQPEKSKFQKNEKKNKQTKKKTTTTTTTKLEISSFNTSVPKIMIICYTVPKIWRVTDVIVIFHFGLIFALLPL